MQNYIFLDNWVLADFTKGERQTLLSEYIRTNNFTILFDGISAAELYNPGWQNAEDSDRTARTAKFLSQHRCVIIRPEKVFAAEIMGFPKPLEALPLELRLDDLLGEHREAILKDVLRGSDYLKAQNIDIEQWVSAYEKAKAEWPTNIKQIIERACRDHVLSRDEQGKFRDLEQSKEEFLATLDRRHFADFSEDERKNLGPKIVDLVRGATKELPAIRFSSLCFWYSYIDKDKSYPMRRKGSDIGDFFQMSLIPYCAVFTIDTTMRRLAERVIFETHWGCQVYDHARLDTLLKEKH